MSFDLVDKDGGEIRATAWNDQVDMFCDMIQVRFYRGGVRRSSNVFPSKMGFWGGLTPSGSAPHIQKCNLLGSEARALPSSKAHSPFGQRRGGCQCLWPCARPH